MPAPPLRAEPKEHVHSEPQLQPIQGAQSTSHGGRGWPKYLKAASSGAGVIFSSIVVLVNAFQIWTVSDPVAGMRPENPFIYNIPIEQSWLLPVMNVRVACSVEGKKKVAPGELIGGNLNILVPQEKGLIWPKDRFNYICQPVVYWLKFSTDLEKADDQPPTPPTQEEWDEFYDEGYIRIQIHWRLFWVYPMLKDFWFYGSRRSDGTFAWRRALDRKSLMEMKPTDGYIPPMPESPARE